MTIAATPAIERIARVLAAQRFSANAEGSEPSASPDVEDAWGDYEAEAIAVLKTLREPDQTMAEAGDAAVWEKMVLAALGQNTGPAEVEGVDNLEPGSNPLFDGP